MKNINWDLILSLKYSEIIYNIIIYASFWTVLTLTCLLFITWVYHIIFLNSLNHKEVRIYQHAHSDGSNLCFKWKSIHQEQILLIKPEYFLIWGFFSHQEEDISTRTMLVCEFDDIIQSSIPGSGSSGTNSVETIGFLPQTSIRAKAQSRSQIEFIYQ